MWYSIAYKGEEVQTPPPPKFSDFFLKSEGKEVERKRMKGGVEIFSREVEIFAGGVEIFQEIKNFSGGGGGLVELKNFKGVEKL